MYNLTYNKTNLLQQINCSDVIIIILIIYISFILPLVFKIQNKYSDIASNIIENVYFKTVLLLTIGYISKNNVRVSLFLLVSVLVSIDIATKYKFDTNINLTSQKSKNNINQLKQKIKKVSSENFNIPLIPYKENSIKENSIKENSIRENSIKENYEANNLNTNYSSYDNFSLLL
jgi:hypothetical protein